MEQLFRKQHYCARNMALKENEIISMFDFKFAGPPQGWFYSRGITKISSCTGLMAYMYCHTIILWDGKMFKHLNFKQFQMKLQVSHFLLNKCVSSVFLFETWLSEDIVYRSCI